MPSLIGVWAASLVLFAALLALSYIDLKTYRLPDILTLPLILFGFLLNGLLYGAWLSSFIGLSIGYGSFVAVERGFKFITGRDGLGRGDAKLMAVGGAWLGYIAIPHIALAASLSAICALMTARYFFKLEIKKIPFGPFISMAIMGLWGAKVLMT